MPTVVYPGSLDPITFGHLGAIRDTAESFGKVVVAIGVNPSKNYMFSLAEREALTRQAIESARIKGVSVTSFSGLLVSFLVRNDLNIVVRGVRDGKDLDDAMLQEKIGWQQTMAKGIKAFYVPARPGQDFTSSSSLKGVLKEQGDVTHMAPPSTIHAVQARMLGQYFYGLTGVSGAGKSSLSKKFKAIAEKRNIPLFSVDLDDITDKIYREETAPLYQNTRKKIEREFGPGLLDDEGFISEGNRKKLGQIVFGQPDKLKVLNGILHEPVLFRMNDLLRGRKGVFLIDAALLAETGKISLVNNQVLVVQANKKDLAQRLLQRDKLTPEQIKRRLSSQFSTEAKLLTIREKIRESSYGHVDFLKNNSSLSEADTERAFDNMLTHVDIYGELRIVGFLKDLGVSNAEIAYTAIRKLYSGDDRFYHTLAHVVDGLNQLPDFSARLEDKKAFTLAWLFHDIVYDTREKDNEEKSADMLEKMCASWGVDKDLISRAKGLVMATKHGVVKAETSDEKYMVDLDLSVFGKSAAEYDLYEQNVRREYDGVSARNWGKGRSDFLAELPSPYFQTDHFVKKLGKQAERNIHRSLAKLIS